MTRTMLLALAAGIAAFLLAAGVLSVAGQVRLWWMRRKARRRQ